MAEEEVEYEYLEDDDSTPEYEYVDAQAAAPTPQNEAEAETVPEFAHEVKPEGDKPWLERLEDVWFNEPAAFKRGINSGMSFGFSENFQEPLAPEYEKFAKSGQYLGEFLPLSAMTGVFARGALALAAKSPILKQQMAALANIVGLGVAGATKEAVDSFTQGEIPTAEDVITEGLIWSGIEAGLRSLGTLGNFASTLIRMARGKQKGSYSTLKEVIAEMRSKGEAVPQADRAAELAMEILERKQAEVAALPERGRTVEPFRTAGTGEGGGLKMAYVEGAEHVIPKLKPPVQGRELKVTNESVNKMNDNATVMAKAYAPQNLSFAKESERIAESGAVRGFDAVALRPATEAELGTAIQADINKTLKAAKAEYKPYYKVATDAAEGMVHTPHNTAAKAGDALIELESMATKPEGYTKTIKDVSNALKDAGYEVLRDENGVITQIIQEGEVTVRSTIELSRRLNEIADFETVVPSVTDNIKKIASAAKEDARAGLKPNSEALAAFEIAESEHGKVAAKYGKDSIMKIRGEQAGEKITKVIDQPSTLGDLKETLSPQGFAQVEREVLEKLNKMSYEKGKEKLRELKPHLTEKTNKLAEQVVNSKNVHNAAARKAATQQGVLNELADSFTAGTRPEKTLSLWKTPQGQKLVSEALEHSPNRPKVTQYLNNQVFDDTVASVMTKEGAIDGVKLAKMMNDPGTVDNIRRIGGDEAVNFFKGMESRLKMLQTNAKLTGKLPTNEEILTQTVKNSKKIGEIGKGILNKPIDQEAKAAALHRGNIYLKRMIRKNYPLNAKINDWEKYIKETLGFTGTYNMNIFGLTKLGIAKTAGLVAGSSYGGVPQTVITMMGYQTMRRLATSPSARNRFIKASAPKTTPFEFIESMRILGDSLNED